MRKQINGMIAALFFVMAVLLLFVSDLKTAWPFLILSAAGMALHVWWVIEAGVRERRSTEQAGSAIMAPEGALTEIVLLGEEDKRVASWDIYGKNGLVIGRDVGENHVSINLENTAYASMIDVEHAVLNYSGDCWYVEDISEKNGVSIQKSDGRKYKLSYGKPCRLEGGDIIYIALTRLMIV